LGFIIDCPDDENNLFIYTDYADLSGKPFFPGLIKYMASGPVVAMVWEGLDAVKTGRVMLGATNPLASQPGTLAADKRHANI
jgi:nucleoside diphosphate kinase